MTWKDPEKKKAWEREWRALHPEKQKNDYKLTKIRREANPEPHRAACRKYRSNNSKKVKELVKAWQLTHPEQVKLTARKNGLKNKYHLTIEEYDSILASQNGVCLICSKSDGDGKFLSVDHDHKCCPGDRSCGKCIRGLLCSKCNRVLGMVGDDQKVLLAAIKYLDFWSEKANGI